MKCEPPARAACPFKANVLTEERYRHPGRTRHALSHPILEGGNSSASWLGCRDITWWGGSGEDSFLVRGGEVIHPNYHGHPAQQPACMQEVCMAGSSYPVSAPVPAQRLHPSAVSHHMER